MNAAINEPEAITHYPTAGTNVMVVASNKIANDLSAYEPGIFSVSLFYLDIDDEASDVYFVEHFTVTDSVLNELTENY